MNPAFLLAQENDTRASQRARDETVASVPRQTTRCQRAETGEGTGLDSGPSVIETICACVCTETDRAALLPRRSRSGSRQQRADLLHPTRTRKRSLTATSAASSARRHTTSKHDASNRKCDRTSGRLSLGTNLNSAEQLADVLLVPMHRRPHKRRR
jgi:hypothetical protein